MSGAWHYCFLIGCPVIFYLLLLIVMFIFVVLQVLLHPLTIRTECLHCWLLLSCSFVFPSWTRSLFLVDDGDFIIIFFKGFWRCGRLWSRRRLPRRLWWHGWEEGKLWWWCFRWMGAAVGVDRGHWNTEKAGSGTVDQRREKWVDRYHIIIDRRRRGTRRDAIDSRQHETQHVDEGQYRPFLGHRTVKKNAGAGSGGGRCRVGECWRWLSSSWPLW